MHVQSSLSYMAKEHIPVLINNIINLLKQNPNFNGDNKTVFVDCTFGRGGYTREILENISNSSVIAIDRDKTVQKYADEIKNDFCDRFSFYHSKFSNIKNVVKSTGIESVDAILVDLGVSSMQIDTKERGFSFQEDAPLDMRMGLCDISAYDVVNKFSKSELECIIRDYGEEYRYKNIVQKIVNARKISPIKTTLELANIVKSAYWNYSKIHPATKTFQAIRIFVNKELEELQKNVRISSEMLKKSGMMFVVSFHSMEDRIVKHFFKSLGDEYVLINKKPIIPSDEEISSNSRARSAKMRVIQRGC